MKNIVLVVAIAAALLSVGCSESENEATPYDAMLGIIARHPCDPAAQAAAIEESDYFDTVLDAAAGRLIREGKVEATPDGLRVTPPSEWPKDADDE